MMRQMLSGLMLALVVAAGGQAQSWAEKMFRGPLSHDFGTIARGARAEHEFVLKNIYVGDVRIVSARPNCGCTSVRISQPTLKTYEQGAIVVSINSNSFLGHQGATISVVFDQPAPAVVQLHVKVFVQPDVTVKPGAVDFGQVGAGQAAEQTLSIRATRGSRWAITAVEAPSERYETELVETARGSGAVEYRLRVRLRQEVEPGLLGDTLLLKTNDPDLPQVPVALRGRVLAPLSASPAALFLGVLAPGQKVSRALVIRAAKPFHILAITADGQGFSFSTAAPGAGDSGAPTPRPLHVISVAFTAGGQPGPVACTIRVSADLNGGAEVVVPVSALVVEP